MLRTIAASYWTALALGVTTLVLHIRWYTIDKAPGSEVVSGFGAALVVLGIVVAARPFLRSGVQSMAEQSVAALAPHTSPYGGPSPEAYAAHRDRIAAAKPDVWAERVVAVAVVIVGTILNGYGPLIARALHLQGT